MRLLILVLLLVNSSFAQDITKYQWKNRVVIIFGTDYDNNKVREQHQVFEAFSNEIADREIIILVPRKKERLKLLKRLDLSNDYSGLILVGKDGGIKLQQRLVVRPETLFNLIDGMPMRRAEIRKKSKKSG